MWNCSGNCETVGVEVSWNYLYGFPGEENPDYDVVLRQAPALVHLQPPSSASRIALERFSPYFEQASLGLENRGPAKLFSAIFRLPDDELCDLIYLFESEPAGIAAAKEHELRTAVAQWKKSYGDTPSLVGMYIDGRVVIEDSRVAGPATEYVLNDIESAAYLS